MAADFTIRQGDTLPTIATTLSDADGAVDLTGAAVRFRLWPWDGGTATVDAVASVSDPTTGAVGYAWQAGDTDAPGLYRAEWAVTFADQETLSFPNDRELYVLIRAAPG